MVGRFHVLCVTAPNNGGRLMLMKEVFMFRKIFTRFRIQSRTAKPLLTAGFMVVSAGCEEHAELPSEVAGSGTSPASVTDQSAVSDGPEEAIRFRSVIFDYPDQGKP